MFVDFQKPKLQAVDQKEELLKKRKLLSHDRDILKKKKKRAIDDLVKKKSVTVKDLLREKRESLELGTASGIYFNFLFSESDSVMLRVTASQRFFSTSPLYCGHRPRSLLLVDGYGDKQLHVYLSI